MTTRTRRHRNDAVHAADLCIEAWAPTREGCIAEAVTGLVDSFIAAVPPLRSTGVDCEVTDDRDADLLVAVLTQVIHRLRAANEVPTAVEVRATRAGLRLHYQVIDAAALVPVGALPKAVSLRGLRCSRRADGQWSCSVTIDV